ncbi:hypothetical protein [Polaromonas sp.]|uniref:hypothetical protein n=1 Tax=Polaromonas sp. TaxID=1869339 RepID=UPI003263098F
MADARLDGSITETTTAQAGSADVHSLGEELFMDVQPAADGPHRAPPFQVFSRPRLVRTCLAQFLLDFGAVAPCNRLSH